MFKYFLWAPDHGLGTAAGFAVQDVLINSTSGQALLPTRSHEGGLINVVHSRLHDLGGRR